MPITITIAGQSADEALFELSVFARGLARTALQPEPMAEPSIPGQRADDTNIVPLVPVQPQVLTGEVIPPQPKATKRKKNDAPVIEPKPEDVPPVITVEQLQAENDGQMDIEDANDESTADAAAEPTQDFDTYATNVRAILNTADFQGLKPITEENARLCRDGIQKLYDTHGDEAARESLKLFNANKVSELRDAHTPTFCEYVKRLKEELSKQKASATREARKSK